MNSILQSEKCCYISGRTDNLHKHHIYGASNRKISDKNGFWVWLNEEYHTGEKGVHTQDLTALLMLKKECQSKYELLGHTRAEFISLIGKNYL